MEPYIEDVLERTVIELCKGKPFEKVRVTEICERAGISKQTFYNHYRDKYDLASHIFDKDIEEGMGEEYTLEILKRNLENIWSRRDFYQKVLISDGQNSLQRYVHQLCVYHNEKRVVKRQGHGLTPEQKYALAYQAYGLVGCLLEWVKGELPLSVEELAMAEYRVFPAVITDTWTEVGEGKERETSGDA